MDVRPLTDRQIELVASFAAQAVIAIENTRLLNELRESLDRQTAMSDVLSVISSSPGELKPVFESMLANAMRICEAQCGFIYRVEAGVMRAMAEIGVPPALAEYHRESPAYGRCKDPRRCDAENQEAGTCSRCPRERRLPDGQSQCCRRRRSRRRAYSALRADD